MIYALTIALIIFGGIFYYCIRKLYSRRFRIIESVYNRGGLSSPNVNVYIPQVKIGGIWLYLHGASTPYIDPHYNNEFIDVQDALECIDKFKSAGNYTIPSNQRLKSNQKAIHVD